MEIIIAVCFFPVLLTIALVLEPIYKSSLKMQERQRRMDAMDARTRSMQIRDESLRTRDAALVALSEAKIAQANNQVVKQDIELEIKKLQLLKLQNELGLNSAEFTPKDYDSSHPL